MPRIFDNLEPNSTLISALQTTMALSNRADFCIGYFNLRGWKHVGPYVEPWSGGDQKCRILVGMQRLPHHQLRGNLSLLGRQSVDNQTAHRLRQQMAREFRDQLIVGVPSDSDESALQRLASQLRAGKVAVKLFLRYQLHAKLYLFFRSDPISPMVGYLGSSNLTFSGLEGQGELNINVLDQDTCDKLSRWFDDRWNDTYCIDITQELADIIEESWARPSLVPPYHVYLKMVYHLSREARAGLTDFTIPKDFGNRLFDFQTAAVKIAAHHLNKRNGILIGDVVGLGKTIMATALARIFEDDYGLETLILCPKNLVPMWEDYQHRYRLRAKVIPSSMAPKELPTLRRYRLVIIDESHNLRNREGKRYRAIQEYVRANDSKCILLSATPYNKTYTDLSNQLRVFISDDQDLGIRPERLLRDMDESEFASRHQYSPRTLAAFDKSEYADDWRDLMRLYMVRRTRSFIQDNYAETDPTTGRKFLRYEDGTRVFFPTRVPRTAKFTIDESDPNDGYARLYGESVVDAINDLRLPRYGLGNYLLDSFDQLPTVEEGKVIGDLSRAGKRLMGFCRTNLFKRLESSGAAFLQSVERHVLRNYVYLHAIRNNLPLPLGIQDASVLDSRFTDEDEVERDSPDSPLSLPPTQSYQRASRRTATLTEEEFKKQASEAYQKYAGSGGSRFKWLRPVLFSDTLKDDLQADADILLRILKDHGPWNPDQDTKLEALYKLLTEEHRERKVLVFSQFADTVRYLEGQFENKKVDAMAGVTGDTADPSQLAWRFSPVSNSKQATVPPELEIRVLISTDLLSEGQNLQDCSVVVNYDLPWTIIRLIQRAGRVDRIGQMAERILCYSFLPADGVDRIINLRGRVITRLRENAEVVGADEAFFENEAGARSILDLYHERAGIMDEDDDDEVDLASHAYQIWKNATDKDPALKQAVKNLPDMVFSSRLRLSTDKRKEGVLVFMRTQNKNDALAYIDTNGKSITESQLEILSAAECDPNTPAQPHHKSYHQLVNSGVRQIIREAKYVGGQLGKPSGARYKTYNRLKKHVETIDGSHTNADALSAAIDDIYRYPLRQSAVDTLNRQLRSGVGDPELAKLVIGLREEGKLCVEADEAEIHEPRIICSMGIFDKGGITDAG